MFCVFVRLRHALHHVCSVHMSRKRDIQKFNDSFNQAVITPRKKKTGSNVIARTYKPEFGAFGLEHEQHRENNELVCHAEQRGQGAVDQRQGLQLAQHSGQARVVERLGG